MKHTVLIADDSRIDRMICKHALMHDYIIQEVSSGREALSYIQNHPDEVSLIVSDLIMPEMDGIQLLEALYADEKQQDTPVIIATSAEDSEAEHRCLELGCWDFVRKPYDPVILGMRVSNTLERRELHRLREQRIVNTFGKYVDPSVVDLLLKDDISENATARTADIVVLFADIRGFTTLSEEMEPQEVLHLINACSTITAQCVKEYHGVLDKFIGDCIMAYWEEDKNGGEAARLACHAALEMQKRTEELFAGYSTEYRMDVALGIGINRGEAIVGNVGSPERMNYTVLGDTVNTAARLESKAPPRKIYISRAVADGLGKQAVCTSLGNSIELKGKHQMTEVLSLEKL